MDIIFVLLPLSLVLALIGLAGYIWSVRSGQLDDLESPGVRALMDEAEKSKHDASQSNDI